MSVLLAVSQAADIWQKRLREHLPAMEIATLGEPFDRRSIHYVIAWKPPPRSLTGLPNLSAILSLGAGVDQLLNDPDLPAVPLYRVIDADLTARMSEYIVLHSLLHMRGLMRDINHQRQRRWMPDPLQPAAHDVRVGIMGFGVLGQDAAKKLACIGFDVAGWSQHGKACKDFRVYAGEEQLSAFLARTDILVVLLPLTGKTHGILNKSLFSGLARDGRLGRPVLINAGRGGLQNEADILEALGDGTLGAASLDVFEVEPLPVESPLWNHPSILITPHSAAMSEPEAVSRCIASQIHALEAGEQPPGLVDLSRGY